MVLRDIRGRRRAMNQDGVLASAPAEAHRPVGAEGGAAGVPVAGGAAAAAVAVSSAKLREASAELLKESDAMTSVTDFRRQLARRVGLHEHGLDDRAAEVLDLIRSWRPAPPAASPEERMKEIVADMGPEVAGKRHEVYLVTLSRALPGTVEMSNLVDTSTLTSEAVGLAVRRAFDEPLGRVPGAPGRPRRPDAESVVKKVAVFRECHADGAAHFHVALLLSQKMAWGPPKRALRERDGMATHWSCSHTQWWSALRYGAIPTLKKTEVDDDPWPWTKDGADIDFFGESQRPWNAHVWKRRREEAEKAVAAGTAKRARRFTKLDLTALILDRDLQTKAALLEYVQDYGTEDMQRYVHGQQKHLKEHLAEAAEWGAARANARAERETDWELVCRTADGPCPHGAECQYARSTSRFFAENRATLSQVELAAALRAIIINGPSKTTRTPMIVGPTNTGKSTVLLPFDDLFGFKNVFHKPAPGPGELKVNHSPPPAFRPRTAPWAGENGAPDRPPQPLLWGSARFSIRSAEHCEGQEVPLLGRLPPS